MFLFLLSGKTVYPFYYYYYYFFFTLLDFHFNTFSGFFLLLFMKSARTTNVYPIPSGWRNTLKMQCCFGWRYSLSLGLLVCYYYCYVRR